jgi:DNA-binding Lrp family transcriptional regulator
MMTGCDGARLGKGGSVTRAYILIETSVGKTRDVVSVLKGLEGMKSVDPVTGPYDIIVVVEGKDLNSIGELVTGKVHPIVGVTRTVTCLAI